MALMQALMQSQQSQRTNPLEMLSKIKQYEKIDAMPDTTTSFTPDQQAGTSTDLETGQSYTPKTGENVSKLEATRKWFDSASKTNHPAEAAIQFSKYPNADPNFAIKYLMDHHNMQKEEANTLLKLVMERQKEKAQLVRDESKSSLDFKRQKELKQMEIDAKDPKISGKMQEFQDAYGRGPVNVKEFTDYIKTTKESPNIVIPKDKFSQTDRVRVDETGAEIPQKFDPISGVYSDAAIPQGAKLKKKAGSPAGASALEEKKKLFESTFGVNPGATKPGVATPTPTGHP